ncbi:metallophosphoesterase [Corynebacterium sp. zg912]|uniref:metallophosphoesterase family protein n=1 Tax=Corynebacterium sp. zg912 TaxID=2656649 RepID=UPI001F16892E|nr:metallophosphoesterase [Corynebacterium sp. zg912]
MVFGDPQLYSTKDLAKQTAGWNNTVTQATKRFPESSFLLSVGDQANHSALQEHGGFISPDPMRAHRTVVTMGNHDYYHAPSYEAMYNRPNVEDENYWFTYNNALVINMDTNDWEDFDDDAAFLRKVVKEQGTDKDWVTLTYHHSTFSQAYHQEDRGIQYWRERMTPVISELDVDLVLGGHDHIYTRSHLMNGYTPVDSGRVAQKGETLEKKKGETQYVTTNSASGSKYYQFFDFKTGVRDEDVKETFDQTVKEKTIRDYTAVWNQNEVPDYTNVEVTPEGLTVTTYDTGNGDVVDAFTLKRAKEEAPAEQPSQGSSDSAEDGSSKGAVIGIVIAIVAALAAAGGAAYMGLIPGVQLPQF